MSAESQAIGLLKTLEACSLKAVPDLGGRWQIGWGETEGIRSGMVWTQEQADTRLEAKVTAIAARTRAKIPGLVDGQLAALVSFQYNVGEFQSNQHNTVWNLCNQRAWCNVAKAMMAWDHGEIGGKEVQIKGLLVRRLTEGKFFLLASPT